MPFICAITILLNALSFTDRRLVVAALIVGAGGIAFTIHTFDNYPLAIRKRLFFLVLGAFFESYMNLMSLLPAWAAGGIVYLSTEYIIGVMLLCRAHRCLKMNANYTRANYQLLRKRLTKYIGELQ